MAKSVQDILALIEENDIKMVDINGQYRHVTIPAQYFSEGVCSHTANKRRTACILL